jgi:hypothetical protein
MKTDTEVRATASSIEQGATACGTCGVLGASALRHLSYYDFVKSTCVDAMHLFGNIIKHLVLLMRGDRTPTPLADSAPAAVKEAFIKAKNAQVPFKLSSADCSISDSMYRKIPRVYGFVFKAAPFAKLGTTL